MTRDERRRRLTTFRAAPGIAAAALLTGCPHGAQAPADRAAWLSGVDDSALRAHVAWLAADERAGRLAGEPGYDDAADYVAAAFERFGLEPGGVGGWLQPVPLVAYRLAADSTEVVVHRDGEDRRLEYREDYGMSADKLRPENRVRADVVYVGYGVHAPEFAYSDYAGVDVAGRIVALFGGAPSRFSHAERAFYASGRTKRLEAVARGAVGFINLRSRRIQEQTPWERFRKQTGKRPGMAWVSPAGTASDYQPEILGSITVSAGTAADLFADAPISFEQALDSAAADRPASVALGVEVTLGRRSSHERFASPNVIGIVRGSDPRQNAEFVVYTAHLDHIGRATAPETDDDVNNGAYDNAMGVAIMLETARVFAANPPARSAMFIALTAEESGLLGSDYFAHHPTIAAAAIVANVNLDMPLFLYPVADLVAFGSEHSSLEPIVAAAAAAHGFTLTPNPLPEENLFVRSDQYSFVRQGIPAVYLIPGFTSTDPGIDGEAVFRDHLRHHYHKPSDDLSRPVDWDSAVRFTRSHIEIGHAVANGVTRPAWHEGDFFARLFARGQPSRTAGQLPGTPP